MRLRVAFAAVEAVSATTSSSHDCFTAPVRFGFVPSVAVTAFSRSCSCTLRVSWRHLSSRPRAPGRHEPGILTAFPFPFPFPFPAPAPAPFPVPLFGVPAISRGADNTADVDAARTLAGDFGLAGGGGAPPCRRETALRFLAARAAEAASSSATCASAARPRSLGFLCRCPSISTAAVNESNDGRPSASGK